MTIFVYILYSALLNKYYVGITEDVDKRFEEHNRGKGSFTSKGIPWALIITIPCPTRSDAMKLEKQIKGRGIKRYLMDNNYLAD